MRDNVCMDTHSLRCRCFRGFPVILPGVMGTLFLKLSVYMENKRTNPQLGFGFSQWLAGKLFR